MTNTKIKFAPDEWYDHHRRKVVWFTASVDGKRVDCEISIEALGDHYGAYFQFRRRICEPRNRPAAAAIPNVIQGFSRRHASADTFAS